MADLNKIRGRDRRPCYVLRVAGLSVLYGTHQPPSVTSSGVALARRAAVVPGSISFGRRYEENTRLVEVDNLKIELACDDQYTADTADPGKVFGRIGFQGADTFTRVSSDLDVTDTAITVLDNSGFTADDIIHVGLESMKVTSTSGGDTVNVTRGVLGTFPRLHRVDALNGSYPYVTEPLAYFRGRRVVLYEGYVNDDGSVSADLSDYVEVFRGFMATEPEVGASGRSHVVTLEIAPLTALLDKPLTSVSKSTRLHPVLHAFDGERCNEIIFASMTTRGSLYTSLGGTTTASSHLFQRMDDPFCGQILNVSDNSISDYHPRNFSFKVNAVSLDPVSDSNRRRAYIGPQPGAIDTSNARIEDIYPDDMVRNVGRAHDTGFLNNVIVPVLSEGRTEAKTVKLTTTGTTTSPDVVNWRETLRSKIAAKLNSGTVSGIDGFLFDISVEPAAGVTTVQPNYFVGDGPGSEPYAFAMLKNHPRSYFDVISTTDGIEEAEGLQEVTSRQSNTTGYTGYTGIKTEIDIHTPPERMLPREAYNLDDANDGEPIRCQVSTDFSEAGGRVLATEVASAFVFVGRFPAGEGRRHSDGERFVVLESALGVASGTSQDVGIFSADGDILAVLKLSDETTVTVDGFTGTRYSVANYIKYADMETIADYAGAERHELRPTIVPSEASIGELILKMLCSMNGVGTTSSAFDEFIVGAGMSDGTGSHGDDFGADVNIDSFLAIPDPAGSEVHAPIYQDGDTLLESIEGLLAATGYTVDIRSDDQGRCQLTAVEVSLPNRSTVAATLTAADIADQPVPQSVAEISIKNLFKFESNFDAEGEPGVELAVKDQVSIDLFNQTEEIDIPLKGINLDIETPGDAVAALRAMFSRLRVENSYPRRVFRFDAPVGILQRLTLGDTVAVTHSLLRAQKGLGVTDEPARVRSIEYDGYQPVGTIELVSYGTTGESWSVTAGVTSTLNSYNLVISEEVHSPARHPATGEDIEELSGFSVGQSVDIYDIYDMDSPITATVTGVALDVNVITIDTAVTFTTDSLGLGIRGFVTARTEASAADSHSVYGFIGSTVTT